MLPSDVFLELGEIQGGDIAKKIITFLLKNKEATDEDMALKYELPIGEIRKYLYVLHSKTIIASRMERNPETGWITYLWYIPYTQLDGLLQNMKKHVLVRLESRLVFEKNNIFYWCNNKECTKLVFNEAVNLLFRCQTCKNKVMHYDNSELISSLESNIEILKIEIDDLTRPVMPDLEDDDSEDDDSDSKSKLKTKSKVKAKKASVKESKVKAKKASVKESKVKAKKIKNVKT